MKKEFKYLLLLMLATKFLLCVGCSPKNILDVSQVNSANETLISPNEIEMLSELSDSIYETGQSIGSFNNMFTKVNQAITDSNYTLADSGLRELLKQIDIVSESDSLSVNGYFEKVLSIYIDQMPSEFVKEDIAILIFQRQMFESLDSLKYTLDDSSDMELLNCRKNASYDIPIVWNDRVRMALHYYLKNKNSTINNWLSNANLYLPGFKKMFSDSGLPQDLAYLPLIESAFNPKAYSKAHASGIWQFIPSTGKLYGLRQNYWIDERRDPAKATSAAISYLKKLYSDFNDWHLALASYNCGEGRLMRTMSRDQTQDYWKLTLPKETMNYVPLFLASLTIAKNPQCFGYTEMKTDSLQVDTVRINDCIDMSEIANGIDCKLETLKKLNPHILHWCTPHDMSNVNLYVPSGKAEQFMAFYSELPNEKKVKWYRYKIRSGDNLISIARHFKLPVNAIKSINKLPGNRITAGKYLFIPIPINSPTPQTQAKETVVAQSPSKFSRPQSSKPAEKIGEKIKYIIKEGDSIWRISEIFGVTAEQIYSWNNMANDRIRVGQVLEIFQGTKSGETISDEKTASVNLSSGKVPDGLRQYKVVSGDTPISIARKFGMTIGELVEINRLDQGNPVIYAGDMVLVSDVSNGQMATSAVKPQKTFSSGTIKYLVSSGDNIFRISQNFSVPLNALLELNDLTENSVIKPGDTLLIPQIKKLSVNKQNSLNDPKSIVYYEIKHGDNLWNIASVFGVPVDKLYDLNNLNSRSILTPGDTIKVIRTGQM